MANNITAFQTYIDMLDEVAANASTTMVLDSPSSLIRKVEGGKNIKIPRLHLSGLADYDKNNGYVQGDVSLDYQDVSPDYDRGIRFGVDAVDNMETMGLAFGQLAGEFTRVHAVPELDAYRFAKYAGTAGVNRAEADLSTGESVISAITAGVNALDEGSISQSDRFLFITPSLLNVVNGIDNTKSKAILDGFANIVKVPQNIFYTGIKLNNGTSDNDFGFAKASTAKNLNFMIISKSAVIQFTKYTVTKVISPEVNPNSDKWLFCYRSYGITDVYDNKKNGIYVHNATT